MLWQKKLELDTETKELKDEISKKLHQIKFLHIEDRKTV